MVLSGRLVQAAQASRACWLPISINAWSTSWTSTHRATSAMERPVPAAANSNTDRSFAPIDILPALKGGDSWWYRSRGTGQGGSCFFPDCPARAGSYTGSTGSDRQPGGQDVSRGVEVPVVGCAAPGTGPLSDLEGFGAVPAPARRAVLR